MKHARLLVLAIALLVAAVAAACGGSSSDSSSSATETGAAAAPTKVRLVYFWPSIDFLSVPIVVAQQKGYFKDEIVPVEIGKAQARNVAATSGEGLLKLRQVLGQRQGRRQRLRGWRRGHRAVGAGR